MPGIKEFASQHIGNPQNLSELRKELERNKDGYPIVLKLANRFIEVGREGVFSSQENDQGSSAAPDKNKNVFTQHPLEAGGILLGALVWEIESSADGKFSLYTVVNRFNNALVGTDLPNLRLEEDEEKEEKVPDEVLKKIKEDIAEDKTYTRALATIYSLPNLRKFLKRNKAFHPLHLAKGIWFPLVKEVLGEEWKKIEIQEFTGGPEKIEIKSGGLLPEGEYVHLPNGEKQLLDEMGKRGFTPEQIEMLKRLRGRL